MQPIDQCANKKCIHTIKTLIDQIIHIQIVYYQSKESYNLTNLSIQFFKEMIVHMNKV